MLGALRVRDLVRRQAVLVQRSLAVVVGNRSLLEEELVECMDPREVAGHVGFVGEVEKRVAHKGFGVQQVAPDKADLELVETEHNRSRGRLEEDSVQ